MRAKKHALIQLLALSATQFSFELLLVRRWYRQQPFWLNSRFSDDRVVSTIRSSQIDVEAYQNFRL